MADNAYTLMGGGRDGGEVRVQGGLPPGAQVRFTLAHHPGRCEVYSLGGDGRLRFDGYGPALGEPLDPALADALRPAIAKVGAALKELEAAYATGGLTPPPLQINEWTLRRV